MKILFLAKGGGIPENTKSGGRVLRWGLAKGLQARGAQTGFFYWDGSWKGLSGKRGEALAALSHTFADNTLPVWPVAGEEQAAREAMREAIVEFKPDLLFCLDAVVLHVARSLGVQLPMVLDVVDPLHLPPLLRAWLAIRHGGWGGKIKAMFTLPATLRAVRADRREFLSDCRAADVVICHARHHAAWIEKRTGQPCLYTPNPVAVLPEEAGSEAVAADPPVFLLVGGLTGYSTLFGLYFFADKVLPHLKDEIRAKRLKIEIVGGGKAKLPAALIEKLERGRCRFRGYVEGDLLDEFRRAAAMVVPTPIAIGFRTRILDAFRGRIAVISHRSNAAGMPELEHDRNSLLSRTGREMAAHILQVAHSAELRERLADTAHRDFVERLNAGASCEKILQVLEKVLEQQRP